MANQSTRMFDRPTFVSSERRLARYVARPILQFIRREVASGILLLIATVAALVWANVSFDSYHDFWFSDISLHVHTWHIELHLEEFVNDALMALFFFVVGLEIKREMVTGRLNSPRVAALPGIAALGGMAVPALFFVAFNAWRGRPGWLGYPDGHRHCVCPRRRGAARVAGLGPGQTLPVDARHRR